MFLPGVAAASGGRGCAAPTACCASSSSSRASSCRRRRGRRSCCPRASRATSPAMLDELTAAGEVVWAGAGSLPGGDGWVALAPADTAGAAAARASSSSSSTTLHRALLDTLGVRRRLVLPRAVRPGRPARGARATAGSTTPGSSRRCGTSCGPARSPATPGRRCASHLAGPGRKPRTAAAPARVGPRGRYARPRSAHAEPHRPAVGERPLVAAAEPRSADATLRAAAVAEGLLDRHGVVTRGAVAAERIAGGFAGVYRVLSAYEDAGPLPSRLRRRGARRRAVRAARRDRPRARRRPRPPRPGRGAEPRVVLAHRPRNPYGAALSAGRRRPSDVASGHRPGRKAGALVVLVDGALGRSTSSAAAARCSPGPTTPTSCAARPRPSPPRARRRRSGASRCRRPTASRCSSPRSPLGAALEAAGFTATPQGLRLARLTTSGADDAHVERRACRSCP